MANYENSELMQNAYNEFIQDRPVSSGEIVVVFHDWSNDNTGCFVMTEDATLYENQPSEFGDSKNKSFSHVYEDGGQWLYHACNGSKMSDYDRHRFTYNGLVSKYKELSGESNPQFIPIYIANSCEVTVKYMWKDEEEPHTRTRDVINCSHFITPNERFMKDGEQLLANGFWYDGNKYDKLEDIPDINDKDTLEITAA